jgi:protein arginine N-methyltransferase 1
MEQTVDFANYFCTYGYLYEQKQMLSDEVRMQAYYDSVFKNATAFKDKIVLDVGTGTGILAIWAAQAGAAKVYAVEATDMAQKAKKLVDGNKVGSKIIVIQGKIEDIDIPEKVDIIISEWMGLFLLRESMLDSVLFARDKWLKPGGSLYPSHARMYIAAIQRETEAKNKYQDYVNSMDDWERFVPKNLNRFGVDMSCLSADFDKEHSDYYLCSSVWCELKPSDLITDAAMILSIDCNKCTLEDYKSVSYQYNLRINNKSASRPNPGTRPPHQRAPGNVPRSPGPTTRITGFAGWFEVDFLGSEKNPAPSKVTLSTAPHIGYTHWGQQCFFLHPPVEINDADTLVGKVNIVRRKDYQRLMNVEFTYHLKRKDQKLTEDSVHFFHME